MPFWPNRNNVTTLVIATHDARVQAALPQALTLHLLAPERATLAQDGVSA